MDFRYMDFSLIWTILFQYFGYMAFCFMEFSLIWTILALTNVVHISGVGCIVKFHVIYVNLTTAVHSVPAAGPGRTSGRG